MGALQLCHLRERVKGLGGCETKQLSAKAEEKARKKEHHGDGAACAKASCQEKSGHGEGLEARRTCFLGIHQGTASMEEHT